MNRFSRDTRALTGLPLRLLIMVIIAIVSLSVILGFLVISKPEVGTIDIDLIEYNYTDSTEVVCDEANGDDFWWKGSRIPGCDTAPMDGYSTELTIKVLDDEDRPMSGVWVDAFGAGVNDGDRTNSDGYATISLEGCHLGKNEWRDEIKITVRYDSTIGDSIKTTSLLVRRPVVV